MPLDGLMRIDLEVRRREAPETAPDGAGASSYGSGQAMGGDGAAPVSPGGGVW